MKTLSVLLLLIPVLSHASFCTQTYDPKRFTVKDSQTFEYDYDFTYVSEVIKTFTEEAATKLLKFTSKKYDDENIRICLYKLSQTEVETSLFSSNYNKSTTVINDAKLVYKKGIFTIDLDENGEFPLEPKTYEKSYSKKYCAISPVMEAFQFEARDAEELNFAQQYWNYSGARIVSGVIGAARKVLNHRVEVRDVDRGFVYVLKKSLPNKVAHEVVLERGESRQLATALFASEGNELGSLAFGPSSVCFKRQTVITFDTEAKVELKSKRLVDIEFKKN